MRHLKAGNRLGVTTAHRRAIMRNMVTSILENGQITCTLARAKEVRKPLEKMIGWGKQGNLHARRQALRFVKSKEAMTQLFEELADRYKDRQGGYCRIIKLGKTRLGDNSEMAIIQLLGSKADQLSELKSQTGKKKKPKKKESSVLKEVSEEIKTESSSETKIETKKEKTQDENEAVKVLGDLNKSSEVPKILADIKASFKVKKAPFFDATGAHAGALLGDILHDPFQSGGLGTPAHERVVAGMIHKANMGVLFIDEIEQHLSKKNMESLSKI